MVLQTAKKANAFTSVRVMRIISNRPHFIGYYRHVDSLQEYLKRTAIREQDVGPAVL